MLEFNNNHIFTGYLKQLLSSFNLPTTKVYSMQQKRYFDTYNREYNVIPSLHRDTTKEIKEASNLRYLPYIKDNTFQEYIKNDSGEYVWTPVKGDAQYYYGKQNLHYTKQFLIKDNIYDSYTHEYLGNYLRFQRDYHDINLMPLYNCFSNRVCNNLDMSFKIWSKDNTTEETTYRTIKFDGSDPHYKIYMVPIKLLQRYTIAIDCDSQVEFCCWFYNKYQRDITKADSETEDERFIKNTYVCKKNMSFGQPFVFNALWTEPSHKDTSDPEYEKEMAAHTAKLEELSKWANLEQDLKLFIKVPFNNSSSITILEGNYLNFNDRLFKYILTTDITGTYVQRWETVSNHTITNYEEGEKEISPGKTVFYPDVNDREFNPITFLQLLSMNTGVSYPFADRLIEYLLGNVITEYDRLEDNVMRVQEVMALNGFYSNKPGLWESKVRPIMYDYINDHVKTQNSKINHDIFGYIDKDVEKYYSGTKWSKTRGFEKVTISSSDLYKGMYNKEVEK